MPPAGAGQPMMPWSRPGQARIQRTSFGPFGKGAISSANALLALNGSLKSARNLTVQGVNQVLVRRGTAPVMAFVDDGASAAVTSVRAVQPFKDRAIVIAHSTVTNKVYYYIVKSDFSGWYSSADALTSTTTASPTGVLWTAITTAPDVSVAEGLGMAFVAHSTAADSLGLNWATYRIVFAAGAWAAAVLTSDLNADSSAENLYFSGVLSFQQTLWGWGFGSGTSAGGTLPTVAPAYDPSKLRFSGIIFTNNDGATLRDFFSPSDSLTEGDRVQSEREKIIAGAVAGNAALFFGRNNVTRVTGYGRDSWVKQVVDRSYGLVGPKAVASDGTDAYYWSNRGPMRIGDSGAPDALWDPIIEQAVAALGGGLPASIVAGFARDLDQIQFFYQQDVGLGLVKFAAFDTRRQIWLGPDSAVGVQIACAGAVEPVYTTASPPGPPAGPPTLTAATAIGAQQFTINWTMGDNTSSTEVYYRLHTDTTWILTATVAPANLSIGGFQSNTYTLTGLVPASGYDVQVRHVKNGAFSAYSTSTTPYASTTLLICTAPSNLVFTSYGPPSSPTDATGQVTWTNTQAGASTEVYLSGPSTTLPADGTFVRYTTATPGTASYTVGPVSTTGTYWARVRHVQSNYSPSTMTGTPSAGLVHFTGIR